MAHTRSDVAPIFESIRTLMDIPRDKGNLQDDEWHERAPAIFTEDSSTLNEQLIINTSNLIQTYPYADLQDILTAGGNGLETTNLSELRFMRKAIRIGRDVVKLCAADGSQITPYRELSLLSRELGDVVDGLESRRKVDIPAAIYYSSDLATKLEDASKSIHLTPAPIETINERATQSLLTEELLRDVRLNGQNIDEKEYHRARKLFRSVVHLGVMSQLTAPTEQKQRFVMYGIELSSHYGELHDAMLAHSYSRSQ